MCLIRPVRYLDVPRIRMLGVYEGGYVADYMGYAIMQYPWNNSLFSFRSEQIDVGVCVIITRQALCNVFIPVRARRDVRH